MASKNYSRQQDQQKKQYANKENIFKYRASH